MAFSDIDTSSTTATLSPSSTAQTHSANSSISSMSSISESNTEKYQITPRSHSTPLGCASTSFSGVRHISVVGFALRPPVFEFNFWNFKRNPTVSHSVAKNTFSPVASMLVSRSQQLSPLNPLATPFSPESRYTSTLNVTQMNPMAPAFTPKVPLTSSHLLRSLSQPNAAAQAVVPRHVSNPCALPFIPTPATNPQPWGAPVNIAITEHSGQLLQRACTQVVMPRMHGIVTQKTSPVQLDPVHEDWQEQQRQAFRVFMENDEYTAHHFSWSGKPVNHKTQTPAALSLAVIMTLCRVKTGPVVPKHNLQKSVRTEQALLLVDPVIYLGRKEVLSGLSMGELQNTGTGLTHKFYSNQG